MSQPKPNRDEMTELLYVVVILLLFIVALVAFGAP